MIFCPDELYHHGVKGQKWGVRHYQNADGSLTPEGYIRYYGKEKGQSLLDYKKAGFSMNKEGDNYVSKKIGDTDLSIRNLELYKDNESRKKMIKSAEYIEKNLDTIVKEGLKEARAIGVFDNFAPDMEYDNYITITGPEEAEVTYWDDTANYARSMYYDIKNKKFTGQYEGWC